jgi:flagellar basal body-associated protein FliL
MADEEKKEDQGEEKSAGKDGKESGGFNLKSYLIMGGIVIAGSLGGFSLAQLIGPGTVTPSTEKGEEAPKAATFEEMLENTSDDAKIWFYDIEPAVVVNLNEPGVTRMLRAGITIELSPKMNQEQGMEFLTEKSIILRGFLTTYLAELTLEQVRGSRNLTRIQNEIKEHFNDLLFPDSRPYVTGIILKDFIAQ